MVVFLPTAIFPHKAYEFVIALAKALVMKKYSTSPQDLCRRLSLPEATLQGAQELSENAVVLLAYLLDQWGRKMKSPLALSTLKEAFSDKPVIQERITKLT